MGIVSSYLRFFELVIINVMLFYLSHLARSFRMLTCVDQGSIQETGSNELNAQIRSPVNLEIIPNGHGDVFLQVSDLYLSICALRLPPSW